MRVFATLTIAVLTATLAPSAHAEDPCESRVSLYFSSYVGGFGFNPNAAPCLVTTTAGAPSQDARYVPPESTRVHMGYAGTASGPYLPGDIDGVSVRLYPNAARTLWTSGTVPYDGGDVTGTLWFPTGATVSTTYRIVVV